MRTWTHVSVVLSSTVRGEWLITVRVFGQYHCTVSRLSAAASYAAACKIAAVLEDDTLACIDSYIA